MVIGDSEEEAEAFLRQARNSLPRKHPAAAALTVPFRLLLLATVEGCQAGALTDQTSCHPQDPEMAAVLDNQVRQKALLTRSPYEVPFGKALIKLTAVGAVYDPLAYLYPYKKEVLRLT